MFAGGAVPWPRLDKRVDVGVRLKRLAAKGKIGKAPPAADGRSPEDLTAEFPRIESCPDHIYRHVLLCLQVDEFKRPTFSELACAFAEILPVEAQRHDLREDAGNAEAMERSADDLIMKEPRAASQSTLSTGTPVSDSVLMDSSMPTPPRPYDRCGDEVSSRIKALEEFLWSEKAMECLGEEAVFEMRMEVESARARDMFLCDRQDRQVASVDEASEQWTLDLQPIAPMQQHRQWSGPCWSLWFYSGGSMHELRFASEEEARVNFVAQRATGTPCVLRDPAGGEFAASSWVSMPARLLRTIRIA
jgi:hypothetical protein